MTPIEIVRRKLELVTEAYEFHRHNLSRTQYPVETKEIINDLHQRMEAFKSVIDALKEGERDANT